MNITEESNISTNPTIKHSFFLNIEQAYIEAVKQQTVIDENGAKQLQYCYYEGALTDISLPNFIQVSQNNFVDFLLVQA